MVFWFGVVRFGVGMGLEARFGVGFGRMSINRERLSH